MQSIIIINILLMCLFQSSLIYSAEVKDPLPDQIPLITIVYAERNITIYTSSSNPSREPK